MGFVKVLERGELPLGSKKTVKVGEAEILLVHAAAPGAPGSIFGLEAKCPHAGAPLEKGALCDGKLICPWHTATFALPSGTWLEPPALRSLKTYSVRVDDESIWVDPGPATAPTLSTDSHTPQPSGARDPRHFILLGAGAASATAVCTLRQEGFTGRITLIDPAADEPIDRTNLSKNAMAGKSEIAALPLWKTEDREALAVEQIKAEATALDPSSQTVTLVDGQTLHFDAALVATGGTPSKLGIPGEDLPHVHTLRHSADLESILSISTASGAPGTDKGVHAVLIGDSFIAFEAGSALTTRGLSVTVVARSKEPFANKWGQAPAQALLALHKEKGVDVRLEAEVASIAPHAVTLNSGETIEADLVLVAIGVKPCTAVVRSLPLSDHQLVKVGRDLKASSHVWAAGDITSVEGTHIEHWRVAQQHGRAAAFGMLSSGNQVPSGEQAAALGVPFFWTAHFGKRFGYAGHTETWDELVIDGSLADLSFLAYYLQDGKVAAVLGCGQDSALSMLEGRMGTPLSLSAAREAASSA